MNSRNVAFIETPPHLLHPPLKLSPLQDLVLPLWDLDDDSLDNDYTSYDDLLRDVGDCTGVLNFTANIPVSHDASVVLLIRTCKGLSTESVISLGETCSCPLNLRLKPHHHRSLCTEQQEGLRYGEHYRRVEGEHRSKVGNFRWPMCRLQRERGRYA